MGHSFDSWRTIARIRVAFAAGTPSYVAGTNDGGFDEGIAPIDVGDGETTLTLKKERPYSTRYNIQKVGSVAASGLTSFGVDSANWAAGGKTITVTSVQEAAMGGASTRTDVDFDIEVQCKMGQSS